MHLHSPVFCTSVGALLTEPFVTFLVSDSMFVHTFAQADQAFSLKLIEAHNPCHLVGHRNATVSDKMAKVPPCVICK